MGGWPGRGDGGVVAGEDVAEFAELDPGAGSETAGRGLEGGGGYGGGGAPVSLTEESGDVFDGGKEVAGVDEVVDVLGGRSAGTY